MTNCPDFGPHIHACKETPWGLQPQGQERKVPSRHQAGVLCLPSEFPGNPLLIPDPPAASSCALSPPRTGACPNTPRNSNWTEIKK